MDWKFAGIIVLILVLFGLGVLFLRSPEDSWIKDSNGIWIKHGNSSTIPDYVTLQREMVECSQILYLSAQNSGFQLNSQCLGSCGDYAIDLVHIPRDNQEDNLPANQCADYKSGIVKHFIELNNINGSVVRVN